MKKNGKREKARSSRTDNTAPNFYRRAATNEEATCFDAPQLCEPSQIQIMEQNQEVQQKVGYPETKVGAQGSYLLSTQTFER